MNVFIRFICLLVFASLLFGGCITSQRGAERKIAHLVKRFPGIIDTMTTDTFFVTKINIDTFTTLDTAYLDRIIKDVCDTIHNTRSVTAYKYLQRNCAEKIVVKTVYTDRIITKNISIPKYIEQKDLSIWQNAKKWWWLWLLIAIVSFIFGALWRRN